MLFSFLFTRWLKALQHTLFSPLTQGAGELFVTSTVAKFYSWCRESPSFTVYCRIWIWPRKRSCVREYEFIFCITAEKNGADLTEDFLASQKIIFTPCIRMYGCDILALLFVNNHFLSGFPELWVIFYQLFFTRSHDGLLDSTVEQRRFGLIKC